MNIIPHKMTLFVAMLFFATTVFAQSSNNAIAANIVSVDYSNVLAYHNTKSTTEKYIPYRFHKRLSGSHTGYVIELTASNLPLERTASIFRQFGNVYYDKLDEGGYSYVIHTNFTSRESLIRFYTKIIKPKTPDARMIEYKEGKRIIL